MARPITFSLAVLWLCVLLSACWSVLADGSALAEVVRSEPLQPPSQWDALWRFCWNLLTYFTLLVPAYFLIRWLQNSPHITHSPYIYSKFLRSCVLGLESSSAGSLEEGDAVSAVVDPQKARLAKLQQLEQSIPRSARLVICALGLQVSYVVWGVLQERVMTKTYGGEDGGPVERFTNSQFLVLVNRVLAFLVAVVAVTVIPHPAHATPLYKYSFCSISNILSSWCQYEALKFVTFPTQVVFKSCKVIPVMLMGKFVSGRSYAWFEYGMAALISLGVSIFLLANTGESKKAGAVTTFAGVVILIGYLTFDSFTSNWQKSLFDQYKVSPLQMMMGVNMFSCLFTLASLTQQGQLMPSIAFLQRHPAAVYNILLLSLFSAVGQLFIYYTVRTFGPLPFTIIMTTRQLISIILSCLIYGHEIAPLSVVGAAVTFSAVFAQAYIKSRGGAKPTKKVSGGDSKTWVGASTSTPSAMQPQPGVTPSL